MLHFKILLNRLKKPSVVLSVTSQIVTILLLFGFNVNESLVLAIVTAACSILVTLGILSNPDTQNKTYGEDLLVCSSTGELAQHTQIGGQMVCNSSGAVHQPDAPPTPA